ncbi:MAG: S4 domain-containing protein YaaA [Bacillales bacterium]|jgi:S4 domain protein YaaA|nr:S4 domain-containing protein YaaA [Bacillales bacterium]
MIGIEITTEYITLGQFLKYAEIVESGTAAKFFLLNNFVLINKEKEQRRGRKLYKGYLINVKNKEYIIK